MEKYLNLTFVRALIKRDFRRYFNNPTGYVFITLFIFLSATAAFWQERFFMNNLANLDQLNYMFPLILALFIPALTMSVWSDEKKKGTDELLLTLPANDVEIVLGKYFAVLGIYTISLFLSLSHIAVLFWLGSPDLGLIFGNYLGYWFAGAALIALGMVASLLTANATVGFILGVLFTSLFVFPANSDSWLQKPLHLLSMLPPFDDFARGIISLSSLFYFLSLAAVMIYLNVILVGKREWNVKADGLEKWKHFAIRAMALAIALISFNIILNKFSLRIDVTAEQMHSLSEKTEELLQAIPKDKPVLIQAFISKEVPQAYAQTRSNLIAFLKEIDAVAGDRVQVYIHDTEPFTGEARDAREKFGINPVDIPNISGAGSTVSKVFLGVAFTSGAKEEIIPFFDKGLPVEYELVRSIRMVTDVQRKKVGVVNSRLKVFGGFDFQTMRSIPAWPVVDELKKQYEVVQISAKNQIEEEVDALLIMLPSSLTQKEMDNLENYIRKGHPTLMLVDPMPVENIDLSPSEKADVAQNPFMQSGSSKPEPKGNIRSFMSDLGISWNFNQIVWDAYNPHPDLAQIQPEIVFIGYGNNNPRAFNKDNDVTAGLQEAVMLYPGYLNSANPSLTFEPLLQTGEVSGKIPYGRIVKRNFFGVQVNRNLRRIPDNNVYTLAAAVSGKLEAEDSTKNDKVNMIVIADVDFISRQFFDLRRTGFGNYNFDNVNLFLNSMDKLAGDESFIRLRNRRVKHRTLTSVESKMQEYIKIRSRKEQEAEMQAQMELQKAQNRLNKKVAEVRGRTDLDERTKQIMAANLQEVENKRFEALKKNIEEKKEAQLMKIKEDLESQIKAIQNGIKLFAVIVPPIPVLILGIWIFIKRRKREKEGAIAARRLRS